MQLQRGSVVSARSTTIITQDYAYGGQDTEEDVGLPTDTSQACPVNSRSEMGPASLQQERQTEKEQPKGEMDSYHSLLQASSQLQSTLQQVTVPVSMKEVGGFIEKQVAYLSGGRGEDSSVIITLPECSAFSDIPEEALAKVFTYLTLIPRKRQPGVKFIIILDRRLDTWPSIKTALARISASFPGNLHLVLVLRPISFFHRTVTDIGFRFSQEDFMLKMPVVMLSSVTDLLRYIEENQLTSEFGGTLDYCHSDWIVLRTAIESFAVTVKDIAHMLQTFGTDVAESDLPKEAKTAECLLESQTNKYRKLKDAIRTVSKEGCHLLSNLQTSGKGDSHWDMRLDTDTVQRLLTQLRDMESAFDGFFEKHHMKLHQYLQLLRYEQSFQEMEVCLDHLLAQEKNLPSSVDSLPQAEHALNKIDTLQTSALDVMARAQIIILHGHQLSASHHYAMVLIMQRCNELRHYCDTLNAALKTKHTRLLQAHQLLLSLGKAQTWCDDGAYLLASQVGNKYQSKEGAQSALKDIENFLQSVPSLLRSGPEIIASEYKTVITPHLQTQIQKTFEKHLTVQQMIQNRRNCLRKLADKHIRPVQLVAPRAENSPRSPLFSPKNNDGLKFTFDLSLSGKRTSKKGINPRKIEVIHDYQESHSCLLYSVGGEDSPDVLKRRVMRELIETERIYVEELLSVLLGYRAEMENPALSKHLPVDLINKRDILFGNMPEIYNFHSRVFLQDLESCMETPEAVGACFLKRKDCLQMYECYCHNKPHSDALWRQFSDCSFFQECQKRLEHKLGLDSYLLKPVQRLTKYQLLLKELLKQCSTDSTGRSDLQEALNAMLDLVKSVNDSMHQTAITGYEGDLCELGRMLMQGSFSVWISHKKGATRMKDFARFKPMQRHLFLYERALLFCKRREEHGDGSDKTPSYSFKHCLKMTAVGITENVKGDVKKFEIWYSGREEVYVIQAPTPEIKAAWLNELRKILTNQQRLLRDEAYQHGPMCGLLQLSPALSESKQQRASVSSEDTESGRSSPDPQSISQKQQYRRSWPGTHQHPLLCEPVEEWSAEGDPFQPDSEAASLLTLTPGSHTVLADCQQNGTRSEPIKSGDNLHLLQGDKPSLWFVKNVSQQQEGFMSAASLQSVLAPFGRGQSCRQREPTTLKVRKLSSPV